MKKFKCTVCGWVYDPELGDAEGNVKAGIPFEMLDEEWVCPLCGEGKEVFEPID